MTKEARLPTATSDWPEFESQPDPVLIIVMYYKCRKPNLKMKRNIEI